MSLEELAKQLVALQKPQRNLGQELAIQNFQAKLSLANSITSRITNKLVQDVIDQVFEIPHRHKVVDIRPK